MMSRPKGFRQSTLTAGRRYKNIDVENTGWISYEDLAERLGKLGKALQPCSTVGCFVCSPEVSDV